MNLKPFKIEACALPNWLEKCKSFQLSAREERASRGKFRAKALREFARMVLIGVPLPAFVIHTKGKGHEGFVMISGGKYHGMLRRLFVPQDESCTSPYVVRLAVIQSKLKQLQSTAIASAIDDECIAAEEPSPNSPTLASLLMKSPPSDLDSDLRWLWTELHEDVCDFDVACIELNRTKSSEAFIRRTELMIGDHGLGRSLIEPALTQLEKTAGERREEIVRWLDLDRSDALPDLAEQVVDFASTLKENEHAYNQIRAHSHHLYGIPARNSGLPTPELITKLATLRSMKGLVGGKSVSPEITDFIARGLAGACRLWQTLLRPIVTRPTSRPDLIIPMIFLSAGFQGVIRREPSPSPTAAERQFAIRFWRAMFKSNQKPSIEVLEDLVRRVPRRMPFIDDPVTFLDLALPFEEDQGANFEGELLDYLNSPSVLPAELLPPHPPAGDDTSAAWTPLHERISCAKRPHIDHLFPTKLMDTLANASGISNSRTKPAESFLNKWLLDGQLNSSKSDDTIQKFIESWKKKYPARHVERWAQAHGIPDLDQLSKLGTDSDSLRQLRTLLQWKAQRLWMLVSHLQVDRQSVGLNPKYVHDRLMEYLPRSFNHPS